MLFVSAPPTIMPFLFPNNLLTEGMRSAVSCQILEGNLPITFKWDKNGEDIPMNSRRQQMEVYQVVTLLYLFFSIKLLLLVSNLSLLLLPYKRSRKSFTSYGFLLFDYFKGGNFAFPVNTGYVTGNEHFLEKSKGKLLSA